MNFSEVIFLIIILIIVIALSIIAIRISLKFDLNKYLENRRRIKLDQLKNICPHVRIVDLKDSKVFIESLFSSPFGTTNWICFKCGFIVDSEEDVNRISGRYGKKPPIIFEKQKEFTKKARKLKIV